MAVRLRTPSASLARGVLCRAVGEVRWRAADEQGASAIDMVIVFPITLFLIFGIIQFGIWYHAADIARAAAQEGARTASAYQSTAAAGAASADRVLSENANGMIDHTSVIPYRDQNVATVTVKGQALQVIPFIPLSITAKATAPVEAFRPPPRS
jgi:Flp pilus assembly protein TadG